MISIGNCDYCGEFCTEVRAEACEAFALPSGRVPARIVDLHRDFVARRYECLVEERHLGPRHEEGGEPITSCGHCEQGSELAYDDLDIPDIDHEGCAVCLGVVDASVVLEAERHPDAATRLAPLLERARPTGPTDGVDRPLAEAALRAYLGSEHPIRWVGSPEEVMRLAGPSATGWLDVDPAAWATGGLVLARSVSAALEQERLDGPSDGLDDGSVWRAAVDIASRAPAPDDEADAALSRILRSAAGPLIITEEEVIIADRPLVLRLDAQDRLHAESGPAVAWGDGTVAHAWHGVRVPAWVIDEPSRISAESIDAETNIEVRRVLLERFGAERYLTAGGAILVHEDATGRLWRKPVAGERPSPGTRWFRPPPVRVEGPDEPLCMVEVRNSTPEPDGTHRTYFLRVPPTMRTAREAVAWTFELSDEGYEPLVET